MGDVRDFPGFDICTLNCFAVIVNNYSQLQLREAGCGHRFDVSSPDPRTPPTLSQRLHFEAQAPLSDRDDVTKTTIGAHMVITSTLGSHRLIFAPSRWPTSALGVHVVTASAL